MQRFSYNQTVQVLHSQMNADMIVFIALKCLQLQMTSGHKTMYLWI